MTDSFPIAYLRTLTIPLQRFSRRKQLFLGLIGELPVVATADQRLPSSTQHAIPALGL